jgi:uncharacterized protein (DUF2147 family)
MAINTPITMAQLPEAVRQSVENQNYDVTDCYLVVFTDESGAIHTVPFTKKNGGNRKANELLAAIRAVGLSGEKYGRYTRKISN